MSPSSDSDIQVIENISSPDHSSSAEIEVIVLSDDDSSFNGDGSPFSDTESESDSELRTGLSGYYYRRLWLAERQTSRGLKRKFDELSARFENVEHKLNKSVITAYFLSAQAHFLRYNGKLKKNNIRIK
jgi:hypothetical protein